MTLTKVQVADIETVIAHNLRVKLAKYKPESKRMPCSENLKSSRTARSCSKFLAKTSRRRLDIDYTSSGPGRTRTCNLDLRKVLLYPIEPRGLWLYAGEHVIPACVTHAALSFRVVDG